MNFPQKTLIKDTVLNGGLIAAAAAWLVFSALQVPADKRALAPTIASTPAQAGSCALVAPPPAAAGKVARKV